MTIKQELNYKCGFDSKKFNFTNSLLIIKHLDTLKDKTNSYQITSFTLLLVSTTINLSCFKN